MGIETSQYLQMLTRLERNKPHTSPAADAVEEEIPLHQLIIEWCKSEKAAYSHSRTDRKATINKGVTDFIIGYKGRVFWIEVKTRTGKRTPEQLAFALLLEMNGLKADLCRSYSEFLSIVQGGLTP